MAMSDAMMWFLVIVIIALLVFWLAMFIDMLNSRRIKKETKVVMGILFFMTWFVTAIVWFFVKKKV